jgi:hypothetical protein
MSISWHGCCKDVLETHDFMLPQLHAAMFCLPNFGLVIELYTIIHLTSVVIVLYSLNLHLDKAIHSQQPTQHLKSWYPLWHGNIAH